MLVETLVGGSMILIFECMVALLYIIQYQRELFSFHELVLFL